MAVGLLIIGHDGIGPALLGTARLLVGSDPLPAKLLNAERDTDPDELAEQVRELLDELDAGEGVLVLADLAGSTPCNVASRQAGLRRVRVVGGLNLPMLINVMNYPGLPLDELAGKALEGGRAGVTGVESR